MQLYDYLQSELSLSKRSINQYAKNAPIKYKVYSIPKRTSGRRRIAHPARPLKVLQRSIVKKLEQELPVHPSAMAYRKGLGIKDNAERHKGSRFLLKMDFHDFFNSISPELLFAVMERENVIFTTEDKYLISRLLFWSPSKRNMGKLVLSVGAPSSPFISNIIMFSFDREIHRICKKMGIKYTRYADDLTFTTNLKGALFEIPKLVRKTLSNHLYDFVSVNESKTVFSSKAHNRHVTGVTLTNDGKLSIGRKRKRYISSMIHKYKIDELPTDELNYLRGLLAFANDIEPDFLTRMIRKYSMDTITALQEEIG